VCLNKNVPIWQAVVLTSRELILIIVALVEITACQSWHVFETQ